MIFYMKGFLVSLCLVSVFSIGTLVSAQGLVPCDGTNVGGGTKCEACHLVQLASNVLTFLIQLAVLLSGIVFAIGGFNWITSAGSSGKIEKGKKMMTNAIIGVIITLAAWLIIDTVLKVFLDDPAYGVWNEIQCN